MFAEPTGYIYPYPRPTVTVDSVILRPTDRAIEILLIRRKNDPFAGYFALPGGYLEMDEEPVVGAARELYEETGLSGIDLSPLMAAGKVGRDPRARCITLIFGALVRGNDLNPHGGDDATHAGWYPLSSPPPLAFDHSDLLHEIEEHLRWQAATAVVGRRLWPDKFSASEFVALHNLILNRIDEDVIARGLRLGLIEEAPSNSNYYKFRSFHPINTFPDWQPLVW